MGKLTGNNPATNSKPTDAESIVCRICATEHNLAPWNSTMCPCGTRIFTSVELKKQILELDKQAHALRVQALGLEVELHFRERRRTRTDSKGNRLSAYEAFWQGVQNAPAGVKAGAKRSPQRVKLTKEVEEAL